MKTHSKTPNPKYLHFFISRLFILRSYIEYVDSLVTVASKILTVTVNSDCLLIYDVQHAANTFLIFFL